MNKKFFLSLALSLAVSSTAHAATSDSFNHIALADFSTAHNAQLASIDTMNGQLALTPAITALPGTSSTSITDIGVAWYLSGTSGTISNTITGLTVGESYKLSYYESAANRNNKYDGLATYNTVPLYWQASLGSQVQNGTSITTKTIDAAVPWTLVTEIFTATSATEVLSFLGRASTGVAPEPILLIGDVTLTAVPEPSIIWMLFTGVLGLAGMKRRGMIGK